MKRNTPKYYLSRFLKADDLADGVTAAVIDSVDTEELGGEEKLVLSLAGIDGGLVLNRTNYRALAQRLGDEPEDWVGSRITLTAVPSSYQGKPCKSIMVGF